MRGLMPRRLGDEARQAAEEHGEDRLIGSTRRQMDLEQGFQLDNAGGKFDQAQPQGVELHDSPERTSGHNASTTGASRRRRAGTGGTGWLQLCGRRCDRRRDGSSTP